MCYCVISASEFTSAGPLSLKQNDVFTFVSSHRVAPIAHCGLNPHWTSRLLPIFVDPRVAACTRWTAEERACQFPAVTGQEEIYLRPSDPSLFNFIVAPWHPLQFLQYKACVMLLGIMLKRVQAHISTMETQQVSINGNSAHDYALLVKLVINTLRRCQKSVTDRVATHSSRHKKLASIISAKLSM